MPPGNLLCGACLSSTSAPTLPHRAQPSMTCGGAGGQLIQPPAALETIGSVDFPIAPNFFPSQASFLLPCSNIV